MTKQRHPDSDRDQAAFLPDVSGFYRVEVSVFDGELWSDRAALVSITAL